MQLDVVKGLEPGVRQAVEHLLAVIKCEQPFDLTTEHIPVQQAARPEGPKIFVSILVVSIPVDQGHIP